MAPGSDVKSEYMKRFRAPRWDVHAPCYRELLLYRLGRRLLEQAHRPWLWADPGPAAPPPGPAAPEAPQRPGSGAARGAEAAGPQDPAAAAAGPPGKRGERRRHSGAVGDEWVQVPTIPARPRIPEGLGSEACMDWASGVAVGFVHLKTSTLSAKEVEEKPAVEEEGKPEQPAEPSTADRAPRGAEPPQRPSALFARGGRKAARGPQTPTVKTRENKHPFALYGWGEKQAATGGQRTHNVCASASAREIHESALRAKSRRQVEKRKLAAQRQRANSVSVEKNTKVQSSPDNPWVTEYMRCYSARA
ncbi:centriole, cilia and spindle-associated protein [Dasypus novemcinctus]|uniref:centriole, cilia and spindle-associated protein n=1 Tax=Dasypus novemcinctus TaxID=9361 RepID=UPI0039C9C832